MVIVILYAIDVERLPWREVMYADRDKRRFWGSSITSGGVKLTLNDLFHQDTQALRMELRSRGGEAKRQKTDASGKGRGNPQNQRPNNKGGQGGNNKGQNKGRGRGNQGFQGGRRRNQTDGKGNAPPAQK